MSLSEFPTARILTTDLVGYTRLQIKKFATRQIKRVEGSPSCWSLKSLVALPGKTALYDLNGQRVDCSEERFVAQSEDVPPQESEKYNRERDTLSPPSIDIERALIHKVIERRPAIFLGYWADHYGHFVTDWSGRLWAHDLVEPDLMPKMPSYPGGVERYRSKPFIAAMLEAAGVDHDATQPVQQPTVYENITVVESAFQVGQRIYSCADRVHRKVAEAALKHCRDLPGEKIYLSRSKLKARLRDIEGEQDIEDEFVRFGFTPISPESIPFEEQISIFNRASVIAGFVGSAFHTGMFSLPSFTGSLIVLCDDRWPNFRLILQSSLKNYRCTFIRVGTFSHQQHSRPIIKADRGLLALGLEHLPEGVL